MALHPNFPDDPHAILDPALRWFPADEALRDTTMDKLMPPLVPELRKLVKTWRDKGYEGATDTIAPNIIVLDRIYKDFKGLDIFYADPVLPDDGYDGRDWRSDFQLTLHVQDDVRVTNPVGNIFLTNIHRVYAGNEIPPSPDDDNTMDYFLGKRPTGATTDDTENCDDVAAYLEGNYPDLEGAVLTIHTKANGEISEAQSGKSKEELDKLREEANTIDSWNSPYKAVVSVLVLKEGWDVRNVTTIVGLRAYAAKSNILPEQTLGRGLRKMPGFICARIRGVI